MYDHYAIGLAISCLSAVVVFLSGWPIGPMGPSETMPQRSIFFLEFFQIFTMGCVNGQKSETSGSVFHFPTHRAHGPIGDHASAIRSFYNFSKFLQWVVLMVKSLKHRGPCSIAPRVRGRVGMDEKMKA